MKKILLIIITISLLFVGCASNKSPYIVDHPETTEDGAPYWTVLTPISDKRFYGVGMGNLSTIQNSKLRAAALAKDEIARQVSTIVDSSITNYFSDSDKSMSNHSLDVFQNFSKQVTNITLNNVIVENNYVDGNGSIWVISSYDKSNLKDAYKTVAENLRYSLELRKIEIEKEIAVLKAKNNEQQLLYKNNDLALSALKKAYIKTLSEKQRQLKDNDNDYNNINIENLIASYEKVIN